MPDPSVLTRRDATTTTTMRWLSRVLPTVGKKHFFRGRLYRRLRKLSGKLDSQPVNLYTCRDAFCLINASLRCMSKAGQSKTRCEANPSASWQKQQAIKATDSGHTVVGPEPSCGGVNYSTRQMT
eukprot:1648260-Amphidinium_carterae.3